MDNTSNSGNDNIKIIEEGKDRRVDGLQMLNLPDTIATRNVL